MFKQQGAELTKFGEGSPETESKCTLVHVFVQYLDHGKYFRHRTVVPPTTTPFQIRDEMEKVMDQRLDKYGVIDENDFLISNKALNLPASAFSNKCHLNLKLEKTFTIGSKVRKFLSSSIDAIEEASIELKPKVTEAVTTIPNQK
jgi:hypothetical protein